VQVDGRAVAMMPRNPAEAAAQQQELAEAARAAQIMGAMFPEEFKMNVDGRKTMKEWFDKARVTVIKMRDLKQVQNATKQMAQLAGARHVGGVDEGSTPTAARMSDEVHPTRKPVLKPSTASRARRTVLRSTCFCSAV
jgi:activator of 2-hydroxyglutaryl-CoA dehydratase